MLNYNAACYEASQQKNKPKDDPRDITELEYNRKNFGFNLASGDIVYHKRYGDVGRVITVNPDKIIVSLRNSKNIVHEENASKLFVIDIDYVEYMTIKTQKARAMAYRDSKDDTHKMFSSPHNSYKSPTVQKSGVGQI